MKRINFLVMLVTAIILSVGFHTCSKDDANNSIVGTWKFKEAVAGEVKTNSTANDEKIRTDIVSRIKRVCERRIWVFRADGTATVTGAVDAEELLKGAYRFRGGVLTLYWEDDNNIETHNAFLAGGLLVYRGGLRRHV